MNARLCAKYFTYVILFILKTVLKFLEVLPRPLWKHGTAGNHPGVQGSPRSELFSTPIPGFLERETVAAFRFY